ncbi:MAG TPA: hypothetical protein VKA87_02730 [Nitrososphaeraceae archaeon]|jgi:hypothetical protein|nr:hypothetical protein [Nitrososphaeraceae archaeon]
MSSYPSDVERNKILEDITKMYHRDLDDELKRKHAEIKDEFRKEQSKMQEEFPTVNYLYHLHICFG